MRFAGNLPVVTDRPMKMLSVPSSSKVGYPPGHDSDAVTGDALPWWKRGLDIVCCLAALPALALCTFVAAILTGITSPGPIFFQQKRVGYRGRRFKLYKFRTMHVRAEVATHENHFAELVRSKAPMQKLDGKGDARLVPGGSWLRASGLDELPQIINVLRGEMSVVGPRPCIPYEYGQYSSAQRERFSSVPGLTGLWQVSGKNRTTFDEMIRLDVEYSRRRSLGLDLRIIIRTIPALWTQLRDTRKAKLAARTVAEVPSTPVSHEGNARNAPPSLESSVAPAPLR